MKTFNVIPTPQQQLQNNLVLVQNFEVRKIVVNDSYKCIDIYFDDTKTFLHIGLSCTSRQWNELDDRLFNVYDIKKAVQIIAEYHITGSEILLQF